MWEHNRAEDPAEQPTQPIYGRAQVPVPPPALREPTNELPPVRTVVASAPPVRVSWHRPSRENLRRLSDGWGLSATGLMIAFIGWGIWAAAGRGQLVAPLVGFLIAVAVSAGVFALSRLIGRLVLERMFGHKRRTARLAHGVTGLFLAAVGLAYLGQTSWVVDALAWLRR